MKILLLILVFISLQAQKPVLLLLNTYSDDINITGWYMSEKLDGVRAYWDGKKLVSRSGKIFKVPVFFTKAFPNYELDGELWSARGDFSHVVSIVNTKNSTSQFDIKSRWADLTYNIFEVPNAEGNFLQRLSKVQETKYLKKIKQIKIKNKEHLNVFLQEVENKQGEGLVVRDGSVKYYTGRNNKALKVKSYIDTECEVVSYNEAKGKYKGMIGSLSCRMSNMKIIKIGSGLSEYQRTNPPKIGSIITFKYYGLTSKGNPRFPIFLRVRK